ncbi:MAG TPA: hypothetical protein PLO23_02275 [Alphaproteobacteria bacterium]|nr:hypothetical protein [Alphaproteobacteria bacterium]
MTNTHDPPETLQSLPPVTEADLISLLNHLEETLLQGSQSRSTLLRQSDLLDSIFNALVAANLKEAITAKFYGKTDHAATAGWLHAALRTQKQCMETLRTISAMDYMENIAARSAAFTYSSTPPTPHRKNDERT